MDQDGTNRQDRLTELKRKLSGECVDFTEAGEEFLKSCLCDETVMESYLEKWKDHDRPDSDADPGNERYFHAISVLALKLEGGRNYWTDWKNTWTDR